MRLNVNGIDTFVATGGRDFDPKPPTVVMLHGAGFDHSSWALHSRWFAHNGFGVLVPDFPGHGKSSGDPLDSVAALADWTVALLDAAGAGKARLIGHSMGSLVALEAAARHADRIDALDLIAAAASIPVSAALLEAAKANDPAATDMMSIWGLGAHAESGGSLAPGLWMLDGTRRVLERNRPGILFQDLSLTGTYKNGMQSAAAVSAPVKLILGERDMMIPVNGGKALAAAFRNARTIVLPGAGHMLMTERPDEVLAALRLN